MLCHAGRAFARENAVIFTSSPPRILVRIDQLPRRLIINIKSVAFPFFYSFILLNGLQRVRRRGDAGRV